MMCTYDHGNGPLNTYIARRNSDKALRAGYSNEGGDTFRLYPVEGKNDTYNVQMVHGNEDEQMWLSCADNGLWIFARYTNKRDAGEFTFFKRENNNRDTFDGTQYALGFSYPP